MVTKKKATKKTAKAVKKEVVEEVKLPEVEEPKVEEAPEVEETKEELKEEVKAEVKEVEKKEELKPIGSLKGGKKVYQGIGTVRTKALRGPISKSKLPADIQKWLTNKGYGTNVYLKDKEWLEKHNVDMAMIEKLKRFINDNYL